MANRFGFSLVDAYRELGEVKANIEITLAREAAGGTAGETAGDTTRETARGTTRDIIRLSLLPLL